MMLLTNDKKKLLNMQKVCYIWKKEFSANDKKDHCPYTGKYRRTAHDICNLRYKTPKEILVVFHSNSTYDYHLII